MVEYKCNKCTKIYNHKGDYDRHINKKKPCTLALSNESNLHDSAPVGAQISTKDVDINEKESMCQYCSKMFTRESSLKRHLSGRCELKTKLETVKLPMFDNNKEEIFMKLLKDVDIVKLKIAENEKFKKEIQEKDKEIAALKANQQGQQIIDKQQINNIDKQQNIDKQIVNNNVKLIAFGKEDMSCLTDNICKQILSKGFQSVPKLIEHLHFNKDKPEYHNVYIPNFRNNFAMVFNGDEWGLRDRDETIEQLKDEKAEFISGKFAELLEAGELSEATIKKLKRFLKEKDEDPADSILKNDIKMILYNKRNMVINTKKNIKLLK
jgi:uncharacterized C2H2 Zn-finger protein